MVKVKFRHVEFRTVKNSFEVGLGALNKVLSVLKVIAGIKNSSVNHSRLFYCGWLSLLGKVHSAELDQNPFQY